MYDLISRQDVLDIIMGDGLYCDTYDDKEYSAERIKSIPTADLSEYCDKLWRIAYERGRESVTAEPMTGLYVDGFNDGYKAGKEDAEPRKGQWIDYCGGVKCDQCGFECDDTYYLGEANFCPNCGARMTEESE